MVAVVVSLVDGSKNPEENSPLSYSLHPLSTSVITLGKILIDAKIQQSIAFSGQKEIVFTCSNNDARLLNKRIQLRLTVLGMGTQSRDLKIINKN